MKRFRVSPLVLAIVFIAAAAVGPASARADKLFLHCEGFDETYNWNAQYKLVVNLRKKLVTDSNGNEYKTNPVF